MKRIFNQKGSTLIIVLIIFSILSVLGTTMFSLAVSNYKMKLINSKSKKNFYFAEAGIEEVYGLIGNLVEESIKEGNESADNYLKSINFEKKSVPYINEDGSINKEYIELQQKIKFKNKFINYFNDNIKKVIENENNYITSKKGNFDIEVKEYDENTNVIKIQSNFNKDGVSKKIIAKYHISIPEYNQPYYIESVVKEVPKYDFITRSITTDGNLIFLKGNSEINGSVVVNKDILFNSEYKKNIKFNGIVVSNNFISDKNSSNTNVEIMKLYTKDDLELNGSKTNINITDGYFGISDGSHSSTPDNSSSIVINSMDLGLNSFVTISKKLYVFGTSYIDTLEKYQTGESISVKGNYKAYSKPLSTGDYSKENVEFKYYNPLILVDRFKNGEKLNIIHKNEYFVDYSNEVSYDNLNLGNNNGINITKGTDIKNIGVVFSNGKIVESNIPSNIGDIIDNLKYELESSVGNYYDRTMKKVNIIPNNDFSLNKNREIISISNSNVFIKGKDSSSYPDGYKIIDLENDKNFKGIIVTSGEVKISGDINFTGTIISGDNVTILDDGKKTLNYNEEYLLKLMGEHEDRFNKIFINSPMEYIPVKLSEKAGVDEDEIIITDNLIELKDWKLIQ